MYDLHEIFSATPVSKIQSHKSSKFDVSANHRFRHSTPSDSAENELVFRRQIADAPRIEADDGEVPTISRGLLR
jgi:hypothetical protein